MGESRGGTESGRGLYGQRPSKSHDEVRRREFARIRGLSVRERMEEALLLGEELDALLPRSRAGRKEPHA